MKSFIALMIFFGVAQITYAQVEPTFLTTFYFEDALGNVDSIEIGYDSLVNTQYDYPAAELGQIAVDQPIDSVFEVRARASWEFSTVLPTSYWYKRLIGPTYSYLPSFDCHLETISATVAIKALHQPIKVSWRQEDFTSSYCRIGGFVAQHFVMQQYEGGSGPFWWNEFAQYLDSTACLGLQDNWTTTFRRANFGELFVQDALVQNPDGSVDTLMTMNIILAREKHVTSPCGVEYTSSVEEPRTVDALVQLLPNPVYGSKVYFLDGARRAYEVVDLSGRVLVRSFGNAIELRSLDRGLYVLKTEQGVQRFYRG